MEHDLELIQVARNYIKQYNRTRDELKEARTTLGKYDRQLKEKNGELRQASQKIENLQHGNQRSKSTISSLRNELINVHQQLEDAKKKYDRELKRKNGELRQAIDIIDNLQQENKRSKDTISRIGNKLQLINVHQQVEDAKKLSDQPSAKKSPPKDTYQNQYYRTRDELKQACDVLEKYDHELKRKNGELRQASHTIENLHYGNQRSKDTISSLQNELINVRQRLENAKKLSDVHEKELVDSRALLTKADTLSESISEVGKKVTALNEEIFQVASAAALGEDLVRKRREVSQTDLDAAAAVCQEMVGEKLTKLLIAQSRKPEPEVNPLLVQVVLQIFMVKFCIFKIQSCYSGDPAIGEILSRMHDSQIGSTKEKAVVSGRNQWHVLTRAHTRPTDSTTETWIEEVRQKLQCVLEVASWAPRSSENKKSCLPSIFKAVNEICLTIGEKFTSTDLHIFVFECDQIYDPAIMEDACGDDRQSNGSKRAPEAIVGTTGIGLAKVVEAVPVKDAPQLQVLIPAKIVLRSTLNDALEPIQTMKKNKPVENVTVDGANQDGRD